MQYDLSVFRLLSFGPLFKIAFIITECALCSLYITELKSVSAWVYQDTKRL